MADARKGGGRRTNPWVVALTVSIATFMEVMDISIANVALRHIAGSLAASQSESTWVLTSYLVSNAIVLPLSGWLSSVLGRKRFYVGCVATFTISSLLCGLAPNLSALLFFRVLQGAGGGGLAPSEQAILADAFPEEQHGMAFALYGVAIVFAPAIGPTLGGWITDTYSWRWIFFINVPFGLLSMALTTLLVEDSAAALAEHERATRGGIRVDWPGFALVAIGLGALQVVLDKGQEDDWLASGFIATFAVLATIGIVGAIVWELWGAREPIVDLPLFRDRGFLFVNVMMFVMFFVLLSSTQLLPQLVQQLLGYDATLAGLIIMPGGFAIMALMPLAGFLVRHVQPRLLIAVGLAVTAAALFHLAQFPPDVTFGDIALARVYQAVGVGFIFVPINTLAYAGLPPGKSSNASALINLMRNLGGSVGISVAQTVLARRTQVHQNFLVGHLLPGAHHLDAQIAAMTRYFQQQGASLATAGTQALAAVMAAVERQATFLAFLDVFQLLVLACLVAVPLAFLLKRIDLGAAGVGAH